MLLLFLRAKPEYREEEEREEREEMRIKKSEVAEVGGEAPEAEAAIVKHKVDGLQVKRCNRLGPVFPLSDSSASNIVASLAFRSV